MFVWLSAYQFLTDSTTVFYIVSVIWESGHDFNALGKLCCVNMTPNLGSCYFGSICIFLLSLRKEKIIIHVNEDLRQFRNHHLKFSTIQDRDHVSFARFLTPGGCCWHSQSATVHQNMLCLQQRQMFARPASLRADPASCIFCQALDVHTEVNDHCQSCAKISFMQKHY